MARCFASSSQRNASHVPGHDEGAAGGEPRLILLVTPSDKFMAPDAWGIGEAHQAVPA